MLTSNNEQDWNQSEAPTNKDKRQETLNKGRKPMIIQEGKEANYRGGNN